MSSTENGHGYRIEALGPQTWDAFADLAGRHNGVWGGCWCTWFHRGVDDSERTQVGNQVYKQRLVGQGRAHAALVFDGDVAVRGASSGRSRSCPTSTTARSGSRASYGAPIFASPVCSSTAVPPQGCSGDSRPWRLGADRHRRRRARRGLPARSPARQEDVGVVSLQRHPDDVRTARVHLPATEGTGQLRHDQGGPCQPRRRGAASPLADQPTPVSRYRATADATRPTSTHAARAPRHRPQGLEVCRRSRLRVLLDIRASQRPASRAHAPTVPVTTETSVMRVTP